MTKNNRALRAVSALSLAESQQPSGVGGCRSCAIRAMCLRPRDASVVCLPELKAARADFHLVRAGDPCEQYCLPRSGALKAYRITPDGREQVMGFYLPGELAGLDGLADGRSQWNLVTLEASSLCKVTHKNLIEAAGQVPELLNSLMRRLSGDMLKAAELATGSSAETRLAGFLIDVAQRIGDACLDGADFCLPMSRQDIASYLALAPETISRLFARLRDDRLIDVDRKRLRILDYPGLSQIAQTDLAA